MSETESKDSVKQTVSDRRFIRSRYLAVKTFIHDERDEISSIDTEMFKSILGKVESIHKHVQKPREQIADAEALLDIACNLGLSVKAESNEGINPSDFVTCLLREYCDTEDPRVSFRWGDITSNISKDAMGCGTMVGPMDSQVKERKVRVQRKRERLSQSTQPEELDSADVERSDTDKNMSAMFDILKKKRSVKLECLVLNRSSFAQTVENIFALSFLVKDGRVKIDVDDNNCHLVSPRNAPSANEVATKEVSYFHFVFRFDFEDWKLMSDLVGVGEELMPHRGDTKKSSDSQKDMELPGFLSTIAEPIKKYSRNRGSVLQQLFI